MIKKCIALGLLSLTLSSQSSLAASVENQSQTSSITIKSNIKSEDSLKSEFVEVIPVLLKESGRAIQKYQESFQQKKLSY